MSTPIATNDINPQCKCAGGSSAGNKYQDFQSAVFLFLFNDSMMQINLWKKSECFSDHKLAALTFGSYILCCRIFPSNLLVLTQPSNVSTFVSQRYKSTMQMCRRICAPPEMNIRILQSAIFLFLFNDR